MSNSNRRQSYEVMAHSLNLSSGKYCHSIELESDSYCSALLIG